MMDATRAREASELLVRHWRDGTVLPALPEKLRPSSRAEGYALQAQIERLSGKPLWGWKIAATSAAGQQHIGVDGPMAGRLLAEMVHADGASLPFGANRMRVAEAEFAFRMARPLPPRTETYSVDEVLDAVAALHTAIEIPDSRFTEFATAGAAQLIADNACAHQFVLGPEATADWRGIDLAAHRVTARVSGQPEREGRGSNVLSDPRLALTWIANELSRHGVTLAAGQVVTTGTCIVPLEVAPGDEVVAGVRRPRPRQHEAVRVLSPFSQGPVRRRGSAPSWAS
ncbi:2-keto-4-pentenoate hydratase [Sabulicella glaciei]|uniref:Fumarylacetoacetate hydrolase family protein n=1 Tax=Sabulicella glaciei TaxID=2984948 RepID=A0ABT3NU52_9PROT|nr:fumarylacetoacetate hydrolase family protein [Roseococcus sp. MDT2-1-1]MCW8085691.1 fumarylacetoacetate hydrolase family protein [Roseococcus sp. MDT2-1-1]